MKSILIVQEFKEADREMIEAQLGPFFRIIYPGSYSQSGIIEAAKSSDAEIYLGVYLSDEILKSSKRLKIFQMVSTGVDRLPLERFAERGIQVCNSQSHSAYVAEYALSMLMALVKKLHVHDRLMRSGVWWRPSGGGDDFLYLSDTIIRKRVGFIGFGRIGQNMAKMLTGFDCEVSAFNSSQNSIVDGVGAVNYCSKEELIENSDIIVISIPLTDSTKSLITAKDFKLAKVSSLWVHISRGPVVDRDDLYQALVTNEIAGVAIDNWFEPVVERNGGKYPSSLKFEKLENVLLSPYRAIYINNGSPHLDDALNNLKNYAEGRDLCNCIDLDRGY
mgnify:CR=1 FL=1|tara:strand:+ start:3036 stop:4034 length:999 start_codon:yes stop_codon:yes gene_type:complete